MVCYNCGSRLSEHPFCTACSADVSLYKKIMHVSNMYYNEGLEKASIRDLSGAIICLRQSVKFNKNNIEARNLLGLVYFEMGEVVAALSEWVISKNLRGEKNIADDYIGMIQSSGSRLEAINQTIKKYNQALVYCMQDSKDLAIIQLKKVLSLNSKFVRAHQLLALLYIDSEQWERANKELKKCKEIDRNNTMTLRYCKEVKEVINPDESSKSIGKFKNDKSIRYKSDNEMIIQPMNGREAKSGGLYSLLNIGIGLAIGVAAMTFLVVPTAVSNAKNQAQEQVKDIANRLDAKTITISELETQINDAKNENTNLKNQLEAYVGTGGTLQTMDELLVTASTYLETQEVQATADKLESIAEAIDITQTSQAFQTLYNTILKTIGPEVSVTYYQEGNSAYTSEDYALAITNLQKAVKYDPENGDALLYLGNAYRNNNEKDKAIETYKKVIELFPETERARKSQRLINDLTEG